MGGDVTHRKAVISLISSPCEFSQHCLGDGEDHTSDILKKSNPPHTEEEEVMLPAD